MNKYDLLLHVDKPDGSINTAFNNAANYARALPGQKYSLLLVVNSKAVTQLVRGAEGIDAEKMKMALDAGLKIKVCRNAINENGLDEASLYPECEVVPAGLVELVERQREGYAYIKP